jgi:hypothetical protein
MDGYILLARCIIDSEVFASQKMLKVWVWCLCKANHKGRFVSLKVGRGFKTVKVERGQFLFGRFKAEEDLSIDGSTIYKIIKKLELLEQITIESNNQYSIITICNYEEYQDPKNYKVTTNEQPTNNQVTAEEQPSNTNNTHNTNKESINNINKESENFSKTKSPESDLPIKEEKEEKKKSSEKKEKKKTDRTHQRYTIPPDISWMEKYSREYCPEEYSDSECTELARSCFDHHAARGWKFPRTGKSVIDWEATLRTYINNDKKYRGYKDIKEPLSFYIKEIKDNRGKEKVVRYENFYLSLRGDNPTKKPISHILYIPNQLSYNQFVLLTNKCSNHDIKFKDQFNAVANRPAYTKGVESLYLLLEKFINKAINI